MGVLSGAFSRGLKSVGQAELAAYHNNFNQFMGLGMGGSNQSTDDASELAVYGGGSISTINAAINRKMQDVRNREYYFTKDGERIDWDQVPDDIRTPFLANCANLSMHKLLGLVVGHEDLCGNALWLKDTQANRYSQLSGMPGKFVPIMPGNFKIKLNQSETEIEYFRVRQGSTGDKIYQPDQVIQFKRDTMLNLHVGLGLIAQSRMLVNGEKVSQEYQNTFLEKDGTPDLIYLDKNMLNPAEAKNKAAQLRSDYRAGKFSNSLMYAYGDVDIKSFSVSSADLQYIESRKFNRDDLISVMESSPIVLGLEKEAGNYAIAQKASSNYFARVNARIWDILESINMQFVYTVKGNENRGYSLSFDEYATGDIAEVKDAVNNGLMTPANGAKAMGYNSIDDVEAANSLYVSAGLRTLDFAHDTKPIDFGSTGLSDDVPDVKKKLVTMLRDYQ